jgi:hypothetical protein
MSADGTRTVNDSTLMVDGNALIVGSGTRTSDGCTLSVGGGTLGNTMASTDLVVPSPT